MQLNAFANTLTDTSELHKRLADKLGVDQGYRQRRADIRKNIKDLEKQLDSIESSLANLETDVRTNKIDTARFEKNFSDRKKKDWLSRIIERINVNYLHDTQEHEVNLRLKIPLFPDASLGIETYRTGDFIQRCPRTVHSTVTDLARLRGWSTSVPLWTATW